MAKRYDIERILSKHYIRAYTLTLGSFVGNEILVEIKGYDGNTRYTDLIRLIEKSGMNASVHDGLNRKCIIVSNRDGPGLDKIRNYILTHIMKSNGNGKNGSKRG